MWTARCSEPNSAGEAEIWRNSLPRRQCPGYFSVLTLILSRFHFRHVLVAQLPERESDFNLMRSKVIAQQIVRAFVATPIHLRRGCADQCTVQIEGPQKADLIKSHVGLNSLECLFADKKRSLHCTIIAPEPNGVACRVLRAAVVWKANRH